MIFAINEEDELCEASPKMNLRCPNCKRAVFSKCGDIRIWHWSHHVNESCEYSSFVDSAWRYEWIKKTSKEKAEKMLNGQIVDVLGNNNAKVLFVDHKIDANEIEEKEKAFKEKIVWVLKSDSFKYLKIYRNDYRYDQQNGHYSFSWKKPRDEWYKLTKETSYLFFDIGTKKNYFYNSFDKDPVRFIGNRLLYINEYCGDKYEMHGRAIEMKEDFFIDRYM